MIVVLAIEVRRHLEPIDPLLGRGQQTVHLRVRAGFAAQNFDRFTRFLERVRDARKLIDLGAQIGQLLHGFLGDIRVVPKTLGAHAPVEFGYRALLAAVVKDAP